MTNHIKLIENLIKVVSDTDVLDTEDVENYYRNTDRIINGSVIDNAWKALGLKGKLIAQAIAEERERMRGYIENAIKYTNWSHSVGSHSDDRGGDSDIECTCNEDEAKYKTEAYRNVLSFLPNKTLTK